MDELGQGEDGARVNLTDTNGSRSDIKLKLYLPRIVLCGWTADDGVSTWRERKEMVGD